MKFVILLFLVFAFCSANAKDVRFLEDTGISLTYVLTLACSLWSWKFAVALFSLLECKIM